jgi:DNA-binding LacI/PurR family transcriptional regulator
MMTAKPPPPLLTPHQVRQVAVVANVDDRTVRRHLRDPDGRRPSVAARIAKAIEHLGLSVIDDDDV